ncbi:hypothetical protein HCN44_011380 [Aphidius gifuensis]|uniref:Uncharacterized protein n=1 Tax=Aphidius gifuensis TaxID=684658 RepID=A0A834Y080_APHGI|nr:solute carrier family 25 member 36-A [Aphidius gifuensis]KAF7994111.1 hypothetical protein HCN44_011380 [Aphidius gifuensis]
MSQRDAVIHLVAGGAAGTMGAIVTCPLEVVKTRLQSSTSGFVPPVCNKELTSGYGTCKNFPNPQQRRRLCTGSYPRYAMVALSHCGTGPHHTHSPPGLVHCLKYIIKYEGISALFKGLGPNLIGVAPSRAIYFCTYSKSKNIFNSMLPPESPMVHVCSATIAGFVTCTTTNPIWFIKTRIQLDHKTQHQNTIDLIKKIYQQSGILGFYKGITASYVGISETVVHFVIYEAVKSWLINHRSRIPAGDENSKTSRDFLEFMAAGAFSKTIASCIAYPHEVARTRLREEGNKYRKFWQTLSVVYSEEGPRGLYRGLTAQLVRQIPNTAIMMATYECVVFVLSKHFKTIPTSSNKNQQNTQFYTERKTKGELA